MEVPEEIQKLLNSIYTDLLMLRDGDWQPDEDSCEASINTVKELASELRYELTDIRDEI